MKTKTVELDSGLWGVFQNDKQIGVVFDRGAKVSGVRCNGYTAYDDWYQYEPGKKLGYSPSWNGAVAIVKRHAMVKRNVQRNKT